jgi:hypothetical protein
VKKLNPYTGKPDAIQQGRTLAPERLLRLSRRDGRRRHGSPVIDDVWKFGSDDETVFKLIKGQIDAQTMPKIFNGCPTRRWKIIAYIRSLYAGDKSKINWYSRLLRRAVPPGVLRRAGARASESPAESTSCKRPQFTTEDLMADNFMVGESLAATTKSPTRSDHRVEDRPGRRRRAAVAAQRRATTASRCWPERACRTRSCSTRIMAPRRSRCSTGPGRRGQGGRDSVADGTIPKANANDLCVIVGVFIHWQASDNKKIYDYNYRATKEAITRDEASARWTRSSPRRTRPSTRSRKRSALPCA